MLKALSSQTEPASPSGGNTGGAGIGPLLVRCDEFGISVPPARLLQFGHAFWGVEIGGAMNSASASPRCLQFGHNRRVVGRSEQPAARDPSAFDFKSATLPRAWILAERSIRPPLPRKKEVLVGAEI